MSAIASDWATVDVSVPAYSPPTGGQVFASQWATTSATVGTRRKVEWWRIIDGDRHPMFVRPRLTPKQKREQLVDGEFFPDAETTGPYDASRLQTINGDVTLSTPGQTLVDKWVCGRVSVTAPNCVIDNCRITGPANAPASGPLVAATNVNVKNLLIKDTEVAPQHPNDRINCIQGHHFKLVRVNAHHGVDILALIGQLSDDELNVELESPWLHDMVMYNTDTQGDNITHNDLAQWHGLLNFKAIGARMEAFCDPAYGVVTTPPAWGPAGANGKPTLISGNPNYPWTTGFSAIMASPPRKLMGGFEFRRGWVDGGAVGFNFGGPAQELMPDGGIVTDTAFGDGFRLGPDFGILTKSFRTMTLSGNHRWNKADPFDASVPFNPRKNG